MLAFWALEGGASLVVQKLNFSQRQCLEAFNNSQTNFNRHTEFFGCLTYFQHFASL